MRRLRFGNAWPAANGVDPGLAHEELTGLAYMVWGRLIALGLLAAWVALTLPFERSGLYLGAIVAFALLGAPPYLLARRGIGGPMVTAAFLLLDAGILTYILIVPPPFYVDGWTAQLNLRLPNFLYLGVFLVGMALSYSPALVLLTGIASIAAWTAGFLWVANRPESLSHTSRDMLDHGLSSEAVIRGLLDPNAVSLTTLYNQIVFLALVTVILALTVWRSRRLVHRQLELERERRAITDLFGRYVPRVVADALIADGGRLQPVERTATVLFVDLAGFASLTEAAGPHLIVEVLNQYFDAVALTVRAHGGVITQFQGDAVLAVFNVPLEDPGHAANAVATAVAIRRLTRERTFGGVRLTARVGICTGSVVAGNVGGGGRQTYTVHGNTVNLAARLEVLNKEHGTDILVGAPTVALLDAGAFERVGAVTVRGLSQPVDLYTPGDEYAR